MLERFLKLGIIAYILLMLCIGGVALYGHSSSQLPPISYSVKQTSPESYSQYVIDLEQGIHTRVRYVDYRYSYSPNDQWQSRADYNNGMLDIFIKQTHTSERLLGSYPFVSLDTRLIWDSDSAGIYVLNNPTRDPATLLYVALPSGDYHVIGEYDLNFYPSSIAQSNTGRYLTIQSSNYSDGGLVIDTELGDTERVLNTGVAYWAQDDSYTIALDVETSNSSNFDKVVITHLPDGSVSEIGVDAFEDDLIAPLYRSPDDSRFAVELQGGGVALFYPETEIVEHLTQVQNVRWGWSPDGHWLTVVQDTDQALESRYALLNVDTGEMVELMRGSGNYLLGHTVAWSPNSDFVMIYALTPDAQQPLRIVDVATGATVYEGVITRHSSISSSWFFWYEQRQI